MDELSYNGSYSLVAGTLKAVERNLIVQALKVTNGRVGGSGGAAVRMDLKRTTLISRMKKLGIDPAKYREPASGRPA